jgi:hypothetical protein
MENPFAVAVGTILGNSLDMHNQKSMYDYRIEKGLSYGMTPYEMFSGPAAGAGGGTSGSAQVLGNQLSAQAMNKQKLSQEITEKSKDRKSAENIANIQANSAENIARINAGVTSRGQDLQHMIQSGNLKLNQDTYNYVTLPKAAAVLQKTKEETKRIINEVVTSTPKFVKYMKMLSMGVDNTMSAFLQNMDGYNLTDPEDVKKMSKEKRKEIFSLMLGIQSGTLKNIEGIKIFGKSVEDMVSLPTLGNKGAYNRSNQHTQAAINSGG